MQKNSPIIVIGMHRSGTTMIAKLIEQSGIFMGHKKEQNQEAIFFLRHNNWLLSLGCATWDHPEFFADLIEDKVLFEHTAAQVQSRLQALSTSRYLGWSRWLRFNGFDKLDFPWGWKDPRNTYTLPFWLKLFPQARVIHVYRHGVDVAASLNAREKKILALHRERSPMQKMAISIRESRNAIDPSPRCQSLQGAFSLWEDYVNQARRHLEEHSMQSLSLCYESFLSSPAREMKKILHHIDRDMEEKSMVEMVKDVNANRAFAFKKNPLLRQFAEENEDSLRAFGYGPNGWE